MRSLVVSALCLVAAALTAAGASPGRTEARRRASTMRLRAIAYSHVRTLALLGS